MSEFAYKCNILRCVAARTHYHALNLYSENLMLSRGPVLASAVPD